MQDASKAVWSIPYIFFASFFPSLKQNFIAYRSSKVYSRPDCIFEIHQLWQLGFSRVYSNFCCSSSFELEIKKNGQSSHNIYSNNILNFQESTTILNAHTKKSGNLLNEPRIYLSFQHLISVCGPSIVSSCIRKSLCIKYVFWRLSCMQVRLRHSINTNSNFLRVFINGAWDRSHVSDIEVLGKAGLPSSRWQWKVVSDGLVILRVWMTAVCSGNYSMGKCGKEREEH